MSTRQESFGFDVFEMAGFTQVTVEDFEARERRRKEQELRDELRRARERQARGNAETMKRINAAWNSLKGQMQ
jgi:hypothetical protein